VTPGRGSIAWVWHSSASPRRRMLSIQLATA
jgi:hypothetical protein